MRMRGLQVAIAIEELGVHQAVADAAPNGEVLDVPQPGHFLQVLDRDVVPLLEHRRLVAAKDAVGVARAGHVQADGSGKAQQLVAADVALDVVQSLVDRGRIGRLEHLRVQLVARVHGQVPLEVGIGGAVLQLPQREVRAAQQLRRRRTRGVGADELRHVLDVEADAAAGRQGHERFGRPMPADVSPHQEPQQRNRARRSSASPPARGRIPAPRPAAARETSPPSSSSEAVVSGSTSGDWREKRATRRQRTRRTSVATSSARRLFFTSTLQPSLLAAAMVRGSALSSTSTISRICGTLRRRLARMRIAGTPQISRRAVGCPSIASGPELRTTATTSAGRAGLEDSLRTANSLGMRTTAGEPSTPGRFPYAAGPPGPANDGGGTTPANAVQFRPLPPAWSEAAPRRRRSPRRFRRQARGDARRNTNRGPLACNAAGRAWRRPSPRASSCRSSRARTGPGPRRRR